MGARCSETGGGAHAHTHTHTHPLSPISKNLLLISPAQSPEHPSAQGGLALLEQCLGTWLTLRDLSLPTMSPGTPVHKDPPSHPFPPLCPLLWQLCAHRPARPLPSILPLGQDGPIRGLWDPNPHPAPNFTCRQRQGWLRGARGTSQHCRLLCQLLSEHHPWDMLYVGSLTARALLGSTGRVWAVWSSPAPCSLPGDHLRPS